MIISRIDGGLGNQMFQYAYGLCLAKKHSTQLLLDIGSYADLPQHGFLLDHFRVTAAVLQEPELKFVPRRYRPHQRSRTPETGRDVGGKTTTGAKIFSRWQQSSLASLFDSSLRRHKESTFGFAASHLEVPDNRYLVGYWQSEKFFPGMRSHLLEEFRLHKPLSDVSQGVAKMIEQTQSIALHIRRGDYVTSQSAAQIYESLSVEYYQHCVDQYLAKHRGAEVFVFSNDIAWCKDQLVCRAPMHWVDHNTAETAHEDMILMSKAAACVIANSTFSWWAAWLNQRPDKQVFAPGCWFRPGHLSGQHIVPERWTQVQDPSHHPILEAA